MSLGNWPGDGVCVGRFWVISPGARRPVAWSLLALALRSGSSTQQGVPFGLYEQDQQVGLARVVTDRATFAWLCDVFVLEEYRGRGLSKWLIECVLAHPDLQGLRRFLLATQDVHGLYQRFGFAPLADPGRFLEVFRPA